MTFLHPGLLALLPLAVIPVLLHLLTLQRLRTVELSTYRFLFDSYVQQRRRMQFLEALLAFLRTAFLLLLVLAVCRPVVKHWNQLFHLGGGSGREVIFFVDCSASMSIASKGESAFKRARDAAKAVAARLDSGDRLTLIRVAGKPDEIFSRFSFDTTDVADRIDSLKVGPSRANFYAALSSVFGPESKRPVNPLVYIFTDCQAGGWKEAKAQGSLDRLIPEGTPVVVVNVGATEAATNLAVLGDPPPRQRAIAGLPVLLSARVVNHARNEPAEVTLSLLVDDKEIERRPLTIQPGEVVVKKLTFEPTEPGSLSCRFEVAGKTTDVFPDDDRFLFTLNVAPRLRVLVVNGNPSADPFDNESLYLKAALMGPTESTGSPPAAIQPPKGVSREFLKAMEVVDVPETGLSLEALREAGVVVLANCGGLNPTHFQWLRSYVADGGGLLILPGDRVNPDIYNAQLLGTGELQRETLSAARLGKSQGDPDQPDTFERLAELDFGHPVLTVFDDPEAQYFREVRMKRWFPLEIPSGSGNARSMARMSNGASALVESRYGAGVVVLAAFPANARWTNFPSKCAREFVPLVLRLVSHAQRRPEVESSAVVPADGIAEFAVSEAWVPVTGSVVGPTGETTALEFERSGPRQVAAFDRTAEKGYYTVEVKGGRTDAAKLARTGFAVNVAADESDPAIVAEAGLKELLPAVELTFVDASADAQQEFGGIGEEEEVWRPLIWLLFLVIGVEFTLATLGGPRGVAGEEETSVSETARSYNPTSWVGRMTGGK